MIFGKQTGQALAEALVVVVAMASFWLAIAWLGRLQDMALQAAHSSRRLAFAGAHQGLNTPEQVPGLAAMLHAPGHDWRMRDGTPMLAGAPEHFWAASQARAPELSGAYPGLAASLRAELKLGEGMVWQGQSALTSAGSQDAGIGLGSFDRLALAIERRSAIMVGSGAAEADGAVQDTLAHSTSAWQRYAQRSRALGQGASARLQGIDAAWGRAQPEWDWLSPWTSWVPENHLQQWRQP